MVNTKKLWLREFVEIGLPIFAFFAFTMVIDLGWRNGMLVTLALVLFTGLFTFIIIKLEFSKPTYPFDIVPEKTSASNEMRMFKPKGLSLFPVLLIGGAVVFSFISASEPSEYTQSLLFIAFVLYCFVGWFIHYRTDRLSIAREGIVLHTILYTMRISWGNIERIERRGQRWFLLCRSSQIDAVPIIAAWLTFVEADKLINLSQFTSNFLEGGMAKSMASFSTAIKVVGTG